MWNDALNLIKLLIYALTSKALSELIMSKKSVIMRIFALNFMLLMILISNIFANQKNSTLLMTILYILDYHSPHIGWVETLFRHIISQQITQWNQVVVLTTLHDNNLPSYEIIDQVHIYRVGHHRMSRSSMIRKWISLIHQYQPDLIHTSTYSAALPAWILSNRYHIPNQLHVHEIYGALWHQFLWLKAYCNKRFEKLIVWLLPRDRYICVSLYTLNSVRTHFNLPDGKLFLESNPVDQEFWKAYDTNQNSEIRNQKIKELKKLWPMTYDLWPIWLYYGRTWVEKWLDLYIAALPEIIKQYPHFHAVIIAPTHEPKPNWRSKRQTSHTLQSQIKQLWIEDYITRLPPVNSKEEIRDRIIASDIVILPSRTEWFGYAMHEVAMMNTSLITTSVGGQIETLSGYDKVYWMQQVTSDEIIKGVKDLLK